KQQVAALAAGAQNRLWNYIDTFYYEQEKEYTPYVTERYIDSVARQVPGLDIAQWQYDRDHGGRSGQVVADDQTARAGGIYVTPGYRLGRSGGPLENFTGSESILFPRQKHPTTFVSVQDLAKAIAKIRSQGLLGT